MSTVKPERKYQAPANTIWRGSERAEAKMPRLTSSSQRPGRSHSASGANRANGEEGGAGDAGRNELQHGVLDHRSR